MHNQLSEGESRDVLAGTPRRQFLRAMTWAAVAGTAMVTLAACGGEGDDDEGNEEDDD